MQSEETVRRAKLTMVGLLLVILLLFGVRLYVVQSLVIQGIELSQLQDQIKTIDIENMRLQAELLDNEAYTTIATKSAAMGFVDGTDKVIYLP